MALTGSAKARPIVELASDGTVINEFASVSVGINALKVTKKLFYDILQGKRDNIDGRQFAYKSSLSEKTPAATAPNQALGAHGPAAAEQPPGSSHDGDEGLRPKPPSGTSKYKGVYFNTSRSVWCAQIGCNGKRQHLGSFGSEEEAARKYDERAKALGKPLNLTEDEEASTSCVKKKGTASSKKAQRR